MIYPAIYLVCLLLFWPGQSTAAENPVPSSGTTLTLSVKDAVLMSLEQNRALKVQRFHPMISRTAEEQAAAVFDLNLSADLKAGQSRAQVSADGSFINNNTISQSVGANQVLATGTTIAVNLDAEHTAKPESDTTRLGLSVTQALLRGRGTDVNLVAIRQARLDTALSGYELHGYTEALVAQVEVACWDYQLTAKRVEIVERSLKLAEEQMAEVRERIAVGRLAEIELAAAEAEAAVRREALINARSALSKARLQLQRLLNSPGENIFGRELKITDLPALQVADPDSVESHVTLAGRLRPDLNQARLQLERGELEVVKTSNGLLPKLDLFVGLGKTGYAASFGRSTDLSGDGYDVQAGLTLRFPWENRSARAAERRAVLSRDQAVESIANFSQLVEVDVRGARIEIDRLREQVAATAVTLRLQTEKLRAETEKFRVGKSTAFMVAQAQRDLLQAETDSVSAVVESLKAVVEFYRLEGSLLERRGISIDQPSVN